MGENSGAKCFPAGWSLAAKPCDSCNTATALLFCSSHAAFMCMGCDAKVHVACELLSPHERVWMCEVCEHAPASVTCKADAAALCVTCDRDIHSANPLARRHERVPVVPFFDTADSVVKSTAADIPVPTGDDSNSFLLSNMITSKFPTGNPTTKSTEFLISDSGQFFDLDCQIPTDPWLQLHHNNSRTDCVVPVQIMKPDPEEQIINHSPENRFEIDFSKSNFNSFNNSYSAVQSLSQSVSSSSMEVGIVPDGCSMSEISDPFSLQMNTNSDLGCPPNSNQASQLSGMDREARVMRYREKRKNRKFEKRIRYASRKAYAETRPRIKGRFAKRTDTESEVDPWFTSSSTDFMGDTRYGVVPSF